METVVVRAIIIVAVVLALLVLVWVGIRVREMLLDRRADRLIDELESVDRRLEPLVFTGAPDYNRTAAALLAQSRSMQHGLRLLKSSGKSLREHTAMVESFLGGVDLFLADPDNDILAVQRGPILKGFVSEVDNSLQTYSVYVPPSYLADRAFPLVVHLHGHGWFRPFQGHPALELPGAIVLSPEGRRASDFMWLGEDDVLRAVDEVAQDYLIDRERVYVSGTSMGGTGAWNLAVHHPDLFAGVGPRAANCDFRAWEKAWGWNVPLEGQHAELRTWLLETDSPVTFIANLAHTPVFVLHAAADTVVPVEHSRAAVERLRTLDAPVEYREYLAGHHGDFSPDAIHEQLAWLAARPRRGFPRTYRFETRSVRHGGAWFTVIEQIERVLEPASVDVAVEGGRLGVRTRNVLALTLRDWSEAGVREVALDDATLSLPDTCDVPFLTFAKKGGAWERVTRWPPDDALRKRRGLEGPVQDVMRSPFVVVAGTGGDDPRWPEVAETEARRFCDEWARRFGAQPPFLTDNELGEGTIASRNVVFFGRPADDSPMKSLLHRLPVTVDDGAVTFAGERFTGADVGTIFCYPTPDVPGRMVAVHTAVSPDALYQVATRFGNWFNWGVHDGRKWFDYCVYDGRTANPETYPLVGFFGTDWSFERGRSWRPTSEALARVRPQGAPQYAATLDVDALWLSDVRPTEIDQMRGAVGFDRSFRGNALFVGGRLHPRGLGVRCPSTLTYALGRRFRELTAVVGFTSEPEEALSASRLAREAVTFVVTGDGKKLSAAKVDWEKPSAVLRVDVRGVDVLKLKVRADGGALWLHGSSAWADLKVTR